MTLDVNCDNPPRGGMKFYAKMCSYEAENPWQKS